MGLVIKQSIQNTISTYLGFGLGAINTLFLYTRILPTETYGLLSLILSAASILMPLFVFGFSNTVIKFFGAYSSPKEAALLNGFVLWFPLVFIVPAALSIFFFQIEIAQSLTEKYAFVAPYLWHVLLIGVAMTYFEIGYAQAKVVLKTAWGNLLKELSHRLFITVLLLLVFYDLIPLSLFFICLVGVYVLRAVLMFVYVLKNCQHSFAWGLPKQLSLYLNYSLYMFLGGTAAVVILEVDKIMIYRYINIEQVAFYTVAVFMATIVGVPARAMYQITAPITAKLLQEGDEVGLRKLYKESSLNVGMVAGGVLLLLLVNLDAIYTLMPAAYGGTNLLVLLIGLSKFYDALMGNNNAILFNSPYYKKILNFGLFLAIATVLLNYMFIPFLGIKGAALASFLAIFFYNSIKIWYVWKKYRTQPFSLKTLQLFLIMGFVFGVSLFIPVVGNLYAAVFIKTAIVGGVFSLLLYFTKTSKAFNELVEQSLRYFK